jgi:hypothetical protein
MRGAKEITIAAIVGAMIANPWTLRAQLSPATAKAFKSLTITCGASPTFDLSQATAFNITLCATPATAVFSNVSRANGRPVSIVVCQDAVGSRSFSYPNTVFGVAAIAGAPNLCTAQSFVVTNSQVFATSTGAQQSNQPVPNLLNAPWNTMTFKPTGDGVLVVANEPTGVLATFTADTVPTNRVFKGYGKANSGTGIITIVASFWVEQPDQTATNYYGFNEIEANGSANFCAYQIGPSINKISLETFSSTGPTNTWGTTGTLGTTFDSPSRQLYIKYSQNLSSCCTASCSWSADAGATWNNFTDRGGSFFGGFSNAYWSIGGSWNKHTGTKMHITSLSVNQQ